MKDDMNTPSRWAYRREYARRSYPPGTRVRLVSMPDDPDPVPEGTCGTVLAVDGAGQLLMQWDNGRSLSLTGEACFDVAHNDDLPFHVKTEELNLEVLGTKFTFRDYPDESKATVDLIRGKVALSDNIRPENKMSLKPNERMTFDKRTGRMIKSGVNANYSDTWARGVLFFDEMPLGEIAKAIERRFNVRIYVADYLKNKKFYGMFNTERKSAADIL